MAKMFVSTVKGFKVFYDPVPQRFFLEDSHGNKEGSGDTQKEMEEKAERLSKQKFKRLDVFQLSGCEIIPAQVTSINQEENTGWITWDKKLKKRGWNDSGREKVFLHSLSLYERNEENAEIKRQVDQLTLLIEAKGDERERLLKKLTGRFVPKTLVDRMTATE